MKLACKIVLLISVVACLARAESSQDNEETMVDALRRIYRRCLNDEAPLSCAKPKVLKYLSDATQQDKVPITEDLFILRSRSLPIDDVDEFEYSSQDSIELSKRKFLRALMLEKLDSYLSSHTLEARLPRAIVDSDIVPRSLVESVPTSIAVPLSDAPVENGKNQFFCPDIDKIKKIRSIDSIVFFNAGRGFVKKVMIPFLLGLKFKATALVPLAFALIAMKTWKALTLGLLSLVLSGAMLIFKLTKPKVAYEVVHLGHPPVEHPPHWDVAAHAPYRAYRK
uniref:Osiris 18 n=1 Tax=Trichogramma kaykai TaxID=54128 RepID=A0ABD2WW34_9HYME